MAGIWFGVLLFALLTYVLLDGYDLGVGIASMFERDKRYRGEMLEQVAQAWDGNESWLVLVALVCGRAIRLRSERFCRTPTLR